MFTCAPDSKLYAWLKDSVSSVQLCYDPELAFEVKTGQGKSWMTKYGCSMSVEEGNARNDWEAATGLKMRSGTSLSDLYQPAQVRFDVSEDDCDRIVPGYKERRLEWEKLQMERAEKTKVLRLEWEKRRSDKRHSKLT